MKQYPQIRYEGAVERNLNNAERQTKPKYKGLSLDRAKSMLGIRQADTRFDQRVQKITAR